MILDGHAVSQEILSKVKDKITSLNKIEIQSPGLAVVIVGEDPASKIYVAAKRRACKFVGIESFDYNLNKAVTEEEILKLIDDLNKDDKISGILVQLPLPEHLDQNKILDRIDYRKDVDGFHPYNIGLLSQSRPKIRSCTPKGIMQLLQYSIEGINFRGMNCVIIGNSNIVGRPMAMELLSLDATVTICNIYTDDIKYHIARADLLVVACGVPELVKGSWIKDGSIVIDVGINRMKDGTLVGDVEFNGAIKRASWITPVPGGIGPMTVASLIDNTLIAYMNKYKTQI